MGFSPCKKYSPALAQCPPQAEVYTSSPPRCFHGLQTNPCSDASRTFYPCIFSGLGTHRAVSHFFLTPHCLYNTLPFLKYICLEAPPAWLRGSAVPCNGSQLGPAVFGTGQSQPLPRVCPAASTAKASAPALRTLSQRIYGFTPALHTLLNYNEHSKMPSKVDKEKYWVPLPPKIPKGLVDKGTFKASWNYFSVLRQKKGLNLGLSYV